MMNNLYVQDVHTFKITPLTMDGSPMIINGTFDWDYEEEFRCVRNDRSSESLDFDPAPPTMLFSDFARVSGGARTAQVLHSGK